MTTLELFLAAIPALTFPGLCGLAVYCRLTDKKRRAQLGQYYNHPDKDLPLYNMGQCDRYSAGTFSW